MLETPKNFFRQSPSVYYYSDLINLFLSASPKSSLAYISAALLFGWIFFPYIPLNIFISIMAAHGLYQSIRLYYVFKHKGTSCTQDEKKAFIRKHTILMLFGSLIWGVSCFLSVLYAPDNYEYIMLALVVAMAAGSISTLSPIFRTYLAFNLPMIFFLIVSFIYKGGEFHLYIVVILPIFTYVLMTASWDMHKTLKHSIELKELYALAKEALKETNLSLEQKVKKEVEQNRQKDRQMLEQSRLAQMGEMLSMIAHQWRQPLSAIAAATGSMDLHMQLDKYDQQYMKEKIKSINTYTEHLSTTITDFRNFFKPDKEKSLTSLNTIVEDSLGIIGTSLKSQGVVVETVLDSKEEIYSYPNELKQVVLNIIKNAQDVFIEKAQEESPSKKISQPSVVIKAQTADTEVHLTIQDNAGGIHEDNIECVFDPYFTTKGKSDGTGLGLYMSKMIVEDHCEGNLSVENRDDGACFAIRLPRFEKPNT